MKIYISADMEGVAGVVHWDQTTPDQKDYERCRRWMTAEVNAAIEGALEAGADGVLVNDSHHDMRNIWIDDLHPKAELISGSVKPLSMVQGAELRADAAFFVGYHARAGTVSGVLDHTYTGYITGVEINGTAAGETAINALVLGGYGTPVVLVTGDDRVAAEARALLGPIETVEVKSAITRYAARSLHPEEARRRIRAAAVRAVRRRAEIRPFVLPPPYSLTLRLAHSAMADYAASMPGAARTDGLTVTASAPSTDELFRAFRAMYNLASLAVRR